MTLFLKTTSEDHVARVVAPKHGAKRAELHQHDQARGETVRSARRAETELLIEVALDALERATGDAEIDEAEEALGDRLEEAAGAPVLGPWIQGSALEWVKERPLKAAVVLDAAVRARVQGLDELIALTLESGTEPTVLRVAGQRARHIPFLTDTARRRAWAGLRRRPEVMRDPAVLPSVAHLGGVDAIDDLLHHLVATETSVADSAAAGLLDLAAGATRPPIQLSDADRDRIAAATLERLKSDDALPTGVWLLGSVATLTTLPAVASALVRALAGGRHLEAPAAIRAGSNLIGEKFTSKAIDALRAAIREQRPDRPEDEELWMHLIVKGRRR